MTRFQDYLIWVNVDEIGSLNNPILEPGTVSVEVGQVFEVLHCCRGRERSEVTGSLGLGGSLVSSLNDTLGLTGWTKAEVADGNLPW